MAKNYDVENYYFVDYENVASGGLEGVETLGENDRVRIFYGSTAGHVAFELLVRIAECKAAFEFRKVEFTLKNALDFKLLFDIDDISRSLSVKNYIIVSKDTDYDEQMKLLRARGISISKIPSICQTVGKTKNSDTGNDAPKTGPAKNAKNSKNESSSKRSGESKSAVKKVSKEKQREAAVRAAVDEYFPEKDNDNNKKNTIAEALLSAKTKAELNNRLQKKFGNDDVKEILKRLKPYISANLKKS